VCFLPVDGPIASVERVARGLSTRLPHETTHWVIPVTADGHPPSPSLLSLIRAHGLRPGVDLRTFRFVTSEGILWTDADEVEWLPIRAEAGKATLVAASVIRSLRGFDPESPTGTWILACANGQMASLDHWASALAAHYIEMAWAAGGPTSLTG